MFKHNDMEDLEAKLKKQAEEDAKVGTLAHRVGSRGFVHMPTSVCVLVAHHTHALLVGCQHGVLSSLVCVSYVTFPP